jgi:hypothetical protein
LTDALRHEAEIFGRYILGGAPSAAVVELYASANGRLTGLTAADADPVSRFALRHPWSIGLLDGALAFRDRDAPLRRRLLIMFAILETQPGYSERFLPRSHTPIDVARVAIHAVRVAANAVLGSALLLLAARR